MTTNKGQRICLGCGSSFTVTKWQKSKKYCRDLCKPYMNDGTGTPNKRLKEKLPPKGFFAKNILKQLKK